MKFLSIFRFRRLSIFHLFYFALFIFMAGAVGCNCGEENPGTDGINGESVSSSEVSSTDGSDLEISRDLSCIPYNYPCRDDGDCSPSCLNISLVCKRGLCVRGGPKPDGGESNPELPPDGGPAGESGGDTPVCPSSCSSDTECQVQACGTRRSCVNGVCSEGPRPCPTSCQTDSDCQVPLCGKKIVCLQGVCSEPPSCPSSCATDDDCKSIACGPRNTCISGQCQEKPKNRQPIAEISPTVLKVRIGDRVILDGGKSRDPDGDSLSYRWSFLIKPKGSRAVFDDPTKSKVAFIADVAGTFKVALVVNDGKTDSVPASATVTALKNASPPPKLAAFSPSSLPVGFFPNQKIRAFGQNFQKGASLKLSPPGSPQPYGVLVVNSTELSFSLPTTIAVGTYSITVVNPDGQVSNALPYQIVKAPKPVLIRLLPGQVKENTPFTLDIYGEKFSYRAKVYLNGKSVPGGQISWVSEKLIRVKFSPLKSGVYRIFVENIGGIRSNELTFLVEKVQLAPVLTLIKPSEIFAGRTYTVELWGERFQRGARVKVGNNAFPSTFVSDKLLKITIKLSQVGPYQVEVLNPNNLVSNRLTLLVRPLPAKPVLTSLSPAQIEEFKAVTIALLGRNFSKGNRVFVNNVPYPTSFVSTTQLRVTLPNTLKRGVYTVFVRDIYNQQSNSLSLRVVPKPPAPVIISITPSKVPALSGVTVTVRGKNFQKGAQIKIGVRLISTKYLSSAELSGQVPVSLKPGRYEVQVFNPDGQKSNILYLTVFRAPPPKILSINPNSGYSGSIVSVRLQGENFLKGAKVLLQGGAQTTTFISSRELVASISLSTLNPGNYQIWVLNPDNQASNKVSFTVKAPQGPQIHNILPKEGRVGTTVNLIVSGARFAKGAKVFLNNKSFAATFLNSSTLGVSLSLKGFSAGTYPFFVQNPDGKKSNIVYFTVKANQLPAPVLTEVRPSTISLSSVGKNNPIYLLGKNFQNGAMMMMRIPFAGAIGLPTNFINSQTLVMTAQFPRIPFPFPPRTTSVYVQNPDGQKSNTKSITVKK